MLGVDIVSNQKTVDQIIKETSSKSNDRNLGELGKDDFLNLLVTQLKYQDPLQPVNDKEFIGQMAQFSSLEQMQNMNKSFSAMKAFTLIGKHVTASIVDDDTHEVKYIEGEVTNIKMTNGKTYAVVNGEDVPVERVIDVSEGGKPSSGSNMSTYTNLIGYLASGVIADPETEEYVRISGTVREIIRHDGGSYAVMDGVKVRISEIITDTPSADPNFMTDYLEDNIGQAIKVKIKDRETGNKVLVEARLREFSEDEFGNISAVLDEFEISVDSIDRVTPPEPEMTLEQALLMQILETLSGTGEEQESTTGDGSGEQTADI